jgi:hypothetical protein
MILANAIGAALLLGSLLLGLLSLVIAVVVETPILRCWWRRKGVWRWVLAANLASLAVGILPTIRCNAAPGVGEGIDPWAWHQHAASRVLLFSGAAFLVTVLVEGAVYALMSRIRAAGLSLRRIVTATLVANVVSYIPMVAYLVAQTRGTGDFTFLPDTTWAAADDTRVYFVDQATNQLCSICLDGSDRRTELGEPLGRFHAYVEPSAFYALLADDPCILYVAPDRRWHARDHGTDRTLSITLPDDHGFAMPHDVASSLQDALAEIGITRTTSTNGWFLDGVYLSAWTYFEWDQASRIPQHYRFASGTTPISGTGTGLVLSEGGLPEPLSFRIWAGFFSLACQNPAVLPDENTVVFRCGDSILVMDVAARRVGRLVRGDSLLLKLPRFSAGDWRPQPSGN